VCLLARDPHASATPRLFCVAAVSNREMAEADAYRRDIERALRDIEEAVGVDRLTAAVHSLRDLLTGEDQPEVGSKLCERLVPPLLRHARSEHTPLCLEAMWSLTNVCASSTAACAATVAHAHFAPTIHLHLDAAEPVLLEQAMWLVGNLLRDEESVYDAVLAADVPRAMGRCAWETLEMPVGITQIAAWALAGLFAGRNREVEQGALPPLTMLFTHSTDEQTLYDAGLGLWQWLLRWGGADTAHSADDEEECARAIFETLGDEDAVAQRVVSMLDASPHVVALGLKLAGHVCALEGHWAEGVVDDMLGAGLVRGLEGVLLREWPPASTATKRCAHTAAMWTLSNVLAGPTWQARAAAPVLRLLPPYWDRSDCLAREAAWCVANALVDRDYGELFLRPPGQGLGLGFVGGVAPLPVGWALRAVARHLGEWWHAAVAVATGAVRHLPDGWADLRDGTTLGRRRHLGFVACAGGRVEVVRWLLERAPHLVNEADADGTTPISTALRHGQHDVVEALLRAGARDEPPHVEPRRRALYAAAVAFAAQRRAVEMLLARGFGMGATAEAAALSATGLSRMVRFCARYSAEWSPLHRAAARRDLDGVRAALRAGYELEDAATAEVDRAACDELEVLEVRHEEGEEAPAGGAGPFRATLLTARPPHLFLGAPEVTVGPAPPRLRVLGWEVVAGGAGQPYTAVCAVRVEADEPFLAWVGPGARMRSVAWREFPLTVMEAARSSRYPLGRPADAAVVALLEEARRPWSPSTHHLFPRSARARAAVVLRALQYRRPLAGSARADHVDDLWLRILELAIDRRDD